jgi:hypothetical protein
MKTTIGNVLLYVTGENPYRYHGDYSGGTDRVRALQQFRDTSTLPAGISAWSDSEKRDVTREEIDWRGMRS